MTKSTFHNDKAVRIRDAERKKRLAMQTFPAEKLVDALLDAIAMRSHPNRKTAD